MRQVIAWVCLVVAILAMATGPVLFALMPKSTPSTLKATWRLYISAIILTPLAYYDYRFRIADPEMRKKARQAFIDLIPVLCVSGSVLGSQFALWAWALDHTSLTSALLLNVTSPNIYVVWAMFMVGVFAVWQWWKARSATHTDDIDTNNIRFSNDAEEKAMLLLGNSEQKKKGVVERVLLLLAGGGPPLFPTLWEVTGAIVGFVGIAALILINASRRVSGEAGDDLIDTEAPPVGVRRQLLQQLDTYNNADSDGATHNGNPEQTLIGDVVAFITAVLLCLYLAMGARARKTLSSWMYLMPVMWVSAIVSLVWGFIAHGPEQIHLLGLGPSSLLGWLGDPRRCIISLAAGIIPGVIGHISVNMAIGQVSPLVISAFNLTGAPISAVYGYIMGVGDAPSVWTAVCGLIVLGAALAVTLGARQPPAASSGQSTDITLSDDADNSDSSDDYSNDDGKARLFDDIEEDHESNLHRTYGSSRA
eukprot:TRINITY_DN10862_c0_g1_i1.p1 TRINITY_DN10862_c0_g1~~TRINITY_DN10862_c0_g1_i1.p1  ORF type:complete len:478 (+),score=110.46 TRINITY_DN10862_c0_g1_i1:67-1500(+)